MTKGKKTGMNVKLSKGEVAKGKFKPVKKSKTMKGC